MVFAHLPAGYLLTSLMTRRCQPVDKARLMYVGLAASVIPDVDIIFGYAIGMGEHHEFVTHLPFFWVAATLAALALSWALRMRPLRLAALVAGANLMLHMVMDSVVSGLKWLYPFSMRNYRMTHVIHFYKFWLFNNMVHWTFIIEICIILAAAALLCYNLIKGMEPVQMPREGQE